MELVVKDVTYVYVKAGRMNHLALPDSRYALCGSHTMYGGHMGPSSPEEVARKHTCKTCLASANK